MEALKSIPSLKLEILIWEDNGRYRDKKCLRLGNRRRVLRVGAVGFAKMHVCSY